MILRVLALLFFIPCSAMAGWMQMPGPAVTAVAGTPPAYQLKETFDGASACGTGDSNCDNAGLFATLTNGDTSSTNGSPLGTYQLELLGTNGTIYWDINNNDETWMTCRFRTEVLPTTGSELLLIGYDNSSVQLFNLSLRATNHQIYGNIVGGSSYGYSTTVIAADTNYWLKVRHKRDTGAANAEFEYCLSTDGTTWTDCISGNTNDTDETQVNKVRFLNQYTNSGGAFYFDNCKVDNENITDATN